MRPSGTGGPDATSPASSGSSSSWPSSSTWALTASGAGRRSRARRAGTTRPTSGGRRRERFAEHVEHALLALTHPLGVEAHEAPFLGGVRRRLRCPEQPGAQGLGVVRGGLLGDDAIDLPELVEDLDTGGRALAGLEPGERALARPC